jgi:23S rRNA (adenine2503-C2)-methyltransferase
MSAAAPSQSGPALVDCDLASLQAEFRAAGHKPVHALKVLRHFYQTAGSSDFTSAAVSKNVRAHLSGRQSRRGSIHARNVAADGTIKLLIALASGGAAESVLMPSHRPDVAAGCVSSQIGCAMGCDFCASTRNGLERNLEAGEIVEQFLFLKEQSTAAGRKLKTLVFMGMGEPLLNLDAVVAAIRRIGDPLLGGLGWRQITVSTVGIVPGIDRLASLDLNVHLALSLHAPDDDTRSRLVPANRRYPLADVLAAARRFQQRSGRIVTIEYCLLAGVNDSTRQAQRLADLLGDFRAHVNLIPYNPVGPGLSGVIYHRPGDEQMAAFMNILRDRNVVAHFRATRGEAINAACGQLRQEYGP